ncbi:MAG: hypothetical protein RL481_129 [Pseudomonadota bacterium]
MMARIIAFLLLLIGGSAIAAKPVMRGSIPVAFQGDWALEGRDCALGISEKGKLRIAARKMTLFEMVGKVVRVTIVDPQTVWVKSRITHNNTAYGSVEIFDNLEMMSLSPDRQTLTTGEGEVMLVYKRCMK